MMNEKELRNNGKLNYFLEKGVKAHVKRVDKQFWNGYIVGKEAESVFIFEEDKLGRMLLFSLDVYDVVKFSEEANL